MFEKIETEEDAYYLGLLLADGCASISKKKSKSISLELKKEDGYIIYRFKKYMNVTNKIQEKDKSTSISIGSKDLFYNLQKFNCVPKKSLILIFPENINPVLYCHLIRGYFDGDGSISNTTYLRKSRSNKSLPSFKRNKWELSFVGTLEFLTSLKLIINVPGILYKVNKKNNKNTYRLSYSHNVRVKQVLDFMYSTATVYMKRKHDRYLEFYQIVNAKAI